MPPFEKLASLENNHAISKIEISDNTERNKFDRVISKAGAALAWLAFLAMAISVFEIIMRYGFDSPTSWVHESVVFLISVVFAIGGPVTMAKNKHIRVRVLYDSVSDAARIWFDRFNDFVSLVFCVVMSYAAFTMFWSSSHSPLGMIQLERSGTSWNPPFPALTKGLIMFALAVMSVQALIHLIESLKNSTPYKDIS